MRENLCRFILWFIEGEPEGSWWYRHGHAWESSLRRSGNVALGVSCLGWLLLALAVFTGALAVLEFRQDSDQGTAIGLALAGGMTAFLAAFIADLVTEQGVGSVMNGVGDLDTQIREAASLAAQMRTGLGALISETQAARNDAIRLHITDGNDHPRFHGQRSVLDGIPLKVGIDLSESVLEGCHWTGLVWQQVDLRGATLRGATLRGTLIQTSFDGADLTGATMDGDLDNSGFDRAILQRTTFAPGSNLRACDFSKSLDLADVRFQRCNAGDTAGQAALGSPKPG